jgi:hypothetical protein
MIVLQSSQQCAVALDELGASYCFTKTEKAQLCKKLIAKNSNEAWKEVWPTFAKENSARLAARYVLKKCAGKGDDLAKLANAEHELTQELKKSLRHAEKDFIIDNDKPLKDQVPHLDESLINYFEQHNDGHHTESLVKSLHKSKEVVNSDRRVAKWQDPLYFAQLLAQCIWFDRTRALVTKMENKAPALARPIHEQLLGAQTRGNRLNDEGNGIIDAKGKRVIDFDTTACIDAEAARSLFLSGVPLLSSVTAYHVISWLVHEVHKQFLLGHRNPNKIVLKGMAYEQLGELSGAGTHPNVVAKIRKIIPALAGCLFKYRTNDRLCEGNLLSYRYERAINRNYSALMIDMQPIACPGFVVGLPKGGKEFQGQRKAIPVTRPFTTYGNQANATSLQFHFQYSLVQEMRNRARELYQNGGILLDDETLAELAPDLPIDIVKAVLSHWVEEGYLSCSKEGLYTLGGRESAARKMLEEAGKYEIDGANAAKRKIAKQRKKIAATKR